MAIAGCPKQQITPTTRDVMDLRGFAEKGGWPVHGGIVDQPDSFLDAVAWIRSEEAMCKSKLRISQEDS